MMNKIMYSTIALGLATTVCVADPAENFPIPVNIEEGGSLKLADFENVDDQIVEGGPIGLQETIAANGGLWYTYGSEDLLDEGSEWKVADKAMSVKFAFADGGNEDSYAGLSLRLAQNDDYPDGYPFDMSACKILQYRYKGSAHNFVPIYMSDGEEVGYFGVEKNTSDEWKTTMVPLYVLSINLDAIVDFQWVLHEAGTLEIDDVVCLTESPALELVKGDLLIDDFEDENLVSSLGYWHGDRDNDKVKVDVNVVTSEDESHPGKVIQMDYVLDMPSDQTWDPQAMLVVDMDEDVNPYDISNCVQLEYDYKGPAHNVRLLSQLTRDDNWDMYQIYVNESKVWTHKILELKKFKHGGWGEKRVSYVAAVKSVDGIDWQIQGKAGTSGTFQIDNVRCHEPQVYEISFFDGETLLESQMVPEGIVPKYEGKLPTRASTEKFDYVFSGWGELKAATKDTAYYAEFLESPVYKIPEGETILVEDFESGKGLNSWGGWFYMYSDDAEGGLSDVSYEISEGENSKVAKLTYVLNRGTLTYEPYVRVAMNVNDDEGVIRNLSSCKVIKYDYKGSAHQFRINSGMNEALSWDQHMKYVPASENWKTETIVVESDLMQGGWGPRTDVWVVMKQATAFDWNIQGETGDEGYLEIDNIRCANIPTYTITFKDGDNVVDETLVAQGEIPECSYCKYMWKESSNKYDYSFNGKFSPELVAATRDTAYQIAWDSTLRKFWVTFYDENEEFLYEKEYEYGTKPKYEGELPTKEATAEYSYTFAGWTPKIVKVTENAFYYAVFESTKNKYTVTFVNDDGTVVSSQEYEYGKAVASIVPDDPRKIDPKGEIVYTFDGWAPEIGSATVTGNLTYTAMFKADGKYTVTFVSDGEVLQSELVEEGQMPEFAGETPVKAADAQYTYTFDGWTPEIGEVSQSVVYTAKFKTTVNTYTITFKDDNGAVLDSKTYEYGTAGEAVELDAPEITRAEDKWDEDYSWSWDYYDDVPNYSCSWPEFSTVTGDTSYVAECLYRVTFVVENDFRTYDYAYGETPEFEDPHKYNTDQYIYTFKGWSPKIEAVGQHSVTYVAQFDRAVRQYYVKFVVGSTTIDSTMYDYGTPAKKIVQPVATKAPEDGYSFTFIGWNKEIENVTRNIIYSAQFEAVPVPEYYVRFVVEGVTIDSTMYEMGTPAEKVVVPKDPVKAATAQYTYSFKAWDKEVADVTESATYTALFDSAVTEYTITFVVDGKETAAEYAYGTSADKLAVPATTKAATAQYTFTFKAWDKELADVTEAATYTALFDSTVNEYTITFVVDGKETAAEYAYGTSADELVAPATKKKATAQYTYSFKGWDKELADVTEAATYTALFDSTVNMYKVKFVVNGKKTTAEYAYGTPVEELVAPAATKDATAKYTYSFKGWDKELADVTEAATYTALFDSTVNMYMVKFVVDGKVVDSTEYAYGTKAADINVPTASKKNTKDSTFTFDGWDKKLATVKGEVTYTAKFTAKATTAIAANVHRNFKFGFANNELTVEQPGTSMVRVQVFDLTGHLVENFNEQVAGSKTFNLAHLNQGSYMVRIVSKSQVRSAKIAIK